MINSAIALFSLTAILGMFLLFFILKNRETPKALVFTHGALAITGFILLVTYSFRHSPGPIESIILFAIAATGGIILFLRDIAGKTIPKWLAVTHGLIAVTGFTFLLVYAFH